MSSETALLRQAAHDAADAAGHDGYLDPVNGLFVMTRGHHLRRGACCGSGCRHCPYDRTDDSPLACEER